MEEVHSEQTLERALADHQLGSYYMSSGEWAKADSLLSKAAGVIHDLEMNPSVSHQIILDELDRLKNQMEIYAKNELQ